MAHKRSNQQLAAIHAKSYSPVIVITTKGKDKVFIGEKKFKGTASQEQAFRSAMRTSYKKIESQPKGTVRVATAVKTTDILIPKKVTILSKNKPVFVAFKTNSGKGSKTKEKLIVERRPGEKKLYFNPELRKTVKGRKFINESKRSPILK